MGCARGLGGPEQSHFHPGGPVPSHPPAPGPSLLLDKPGRGAVRGPQQPLLLRPAGKYCRAKRAVPAVDSGAASGSVSPCGSHELRGVCPAGGRRGAEGQLHPVPVPVQSSQWLRWAHGCRRLWLYGTDPKALKNTISKFAFQMEK